MTGHGFTLLLLIVVIYSVVAAWLGHRSVTMPMVFVLGGWALSRVPGILSLAPDAHLVKEVTEVTLALLLFADASTLDVHRVRRDAPLATRLLTIGLLLSIAHGDAVELREEPHDFVPAARAVMRARRSSGA